MPNNLYERINELSTEMDLQTSGDWIEALQIEPQKYYQLRYNLEIGRGVRYSTLEMLANGLNKLPLILKDLDTGWIIRSKKKHVLYNNSLPKNYIPESFEIQRQRKGFNKAKVARRSDISPITYLNIVNKGIISRTPTLENISEALNIEVLYLHDKKHKGEIICKDCGLVVEENSSYQETHKELLKIGRNAMKTPLDYDINKVKEAIEFIDKIDTEVRKYLIVGLNKIRKARCKRTSEYKESLKSK